jgi:hypothetical protein
MKASAGSEAARGSARIWLAIAFCLVVPALIWAAVTYWHPPAAGDASVESAVTPPLHRNAASASTGGAPADLTGALSRLDDAFTNFPGVAPERVLQLVHKDGLTRGESVCSFEWNGGNVSLLFGSGAGNDPGSAINRCADAVEKAAIR